MIWWLLFWGGANIYSQKWTEDRRKLKNYSEYKSSTFYQCFFPHILAALRRCPPVVGYIWKPCLLWFKSSSYRDHLLDLKRKKKMQLKSEYTLHALVSERISNAEQSVSRFLFMLSLQTTITLFRCKHYFFHETYTNSGSQIIQFAGYFPWALNWSKTAILSSLYNNICWI